MERQKKNQYLRHCKKLFSGGLCLTSLAWMLSSLTACTETGQLRPVELRCESMVNPSVVDCDVPRLSWINQTTSAQIRGEKQTAYRLRVASSKELLTAGKADVWDSRVVASGQSHLVPYGGPALESGKDYWWAVQTYDKKGHASPWSEPACWGMGLLEDSLWQAQWIGAPWQDERPRRELKPIPIGGSIQEIMAAMNPPSQPLLPAPLLRKSFAVENKEIKQAKVFVTGLGYFELYVNNQKVGDDCLVPNFTDYTRRKGLKSSDIYPDDRTSGYRVMYLAYDVTGLIQPGKNALGAILGDGFYDTTSFWDCAYGSPRFLCQLHLTYADGSRQTIATDGTWLAKQSAIRMNGVFDGEVYDARMETPDWAGNACDESKGWMPVSLREAPKGKLVAHTSPTDKVVEKIVPLSLEKIGDKTWLADFGTENAGWIRFSRVKGKAGDTLSVRYLCETPSGVQKYVFRGEAEGENYAPRFTWYVFRKAVISGVEQLDTAQIRAEKVNTALRTTAEWETSNPLFNQINAIWQRTQTNNMHGGIASDCPHRERSPYTGDGQVAQLTVMHNFDAEAFYRKWITDIRLAQNPETGYVPNSAPWQPKCGGGPAWGAALNLMPWEFYLQYGDARLLADCYDGMKAQLLFMQRSLTEDGTMHQTLSALPGWPVTQWLNLGEWCAPGPSPSDELVHTFYLWLCADCTARTAQALGLDGDAAIYRQLAMRMKEAFHRKFYDAHSHSYGKYGSNVFALKMGVPDSCRQDVAETLRRQLVEENNMHLDTGIYGTRYLFEILAENNMNDVAYALMNQHTYPSFGYWIEQGATTMWERWNGADSHDHPMMGGGLTWFYRCLAGVRTDEAIPGYRHIIIRPQMPDSLQYVRYSHKTPYGKVRSRWEKQGHQITMEVEIPVGSVATVYLPASTPSQVTESGQPLDNAPGIRVVRQNEDSLQLEVAQGTYRFVIANEEAKDSSKSKG